MKIEVRYWGTPFTSAEVENLRTILRLENHEQAIVVARRITAALYACNILMEARRAVPDVREGKLRLRSIARRSLELADLLSTEPAADTLFCFPGTLRERKDKRGRKVPIYKALEADKRRLAELIHDLRLIASVTKIHLADDQTFRGFRSLLPASAASAAIYAHILWPNLFEIWTFAGRTPSATENGPTYRFLELVHRAVSLPDPNPRTMRDAIERWKKANKPGVYGGIPPWRVEDDD